MAQTVLLRRSAVQGKIPQTTDLQLGEIAINTYDGKVYIKKSDGSNEEIVEVTGGTSGQGVYDKTEYTASGGETSINVPYQVGYVDVFVNGVKAEEGTDYTADNGTSIDFTNALNQNDYVEIFAWKMVDLTSISNLMQRKDYVATDGQTEFNINYDKDNSIVDVYVSGTLLPPSDYTANDGQKVVLNNGVSQGTEVTIIVAGGSFITGSGFSYKSVNSNYTANV